MELLLGITDNIKKDNLLPPILLLPYLHGLEDSNIVQGLIKINSYNSLLNYWNSLLSNVSKMEKWLKILFLFVVNLKAGYLLKSSFMLLKGGWKIV